MHNAGIVSINNELNASSGAPEYPAACDEAPHERADKCSINSYCFRRKRCLASNSNKQCIMIHVAQNFDSINLGQFNG